MHSVWAAGLLLVSIMASGIAYSWLQLFVLQLHNLATYMEWRTSFEFLFQRQAQELLHSPDFLHRIRGHFRHSTLELVYNLPFQTHHEPHTSSWNNNSFLNTGADRGSATKLWDALRLRLVCTACFDPPLRVIVSENDLPRSFGSTFSNAVRSYLYVSLVCCYYPFVLKPFNFY